MKSHLISLISFHTTAQKVFLDSDSFFIDPPRKKECFFHIEKSFIALFLMNNYSSSD